MCEAASFAPAASERSAAWCAAAPAAIAFSTIGHSMSFRMAARSMGSEGRGGTHGLKRAPVEGEHELFGFLATTANAIVAPIHPEAMPVILTTRNEVDRRLDGDTTAALKLQLHLQPS
jgi:hypothetical protein